MMQITRGQVLKYTILPGILPRIYEIFATGFGYIPYLMAQVYNATGILPHGHAYLNPANMGRYGVRHVIAEAANNLIFDRKHADRVFIFFVILTGVVLLFMQILLLILAALVQKQVFALSYTNLFGPFTDDARPQDLAFIMLDHVFGTVNIFDSCLQGMVACVDLHNNPLPAFGPYPAPFHKALHALLRFYSLGIFSVAALVVVYFIIAITAETAASGTPFGQRLNRAWAPVRLILCFALLIPLNTGGSNIGAGTGINAGLNMAQLITFRVAKLGSNFATNGWNYFNNKIAQKYLDDTTQLIGAPNTPKVNGLLSFMFVAHTCKVAENVLYPHGPDGIQAYLVREMQFGAALMPGPNAIPMDATDYATARKFSNNGSISIRFGELSAEKFLMDNGHVNPFCGELSLPVSKIDAAGAEASGAAEIQQVYYNLVRLLWRDANMAAHAACLRGRNTQYDPDPNCAAYPDLTFIGDQVVFYQDLLDDGIKAGVATQAALVDAWAVDATLIDKGWAGAGIWYNRLAELNGDISAAVFSTPQATGNPYIMETIASQHRANNAEATPQTIYDPELAQGKEIDYPRSNKDAEIAIALNKAYLLWQANDVFKDDMNNENNSPFINAVNATFGTSGLFSMRKNTSIHPLAQLSILGKGMMYASLRNFAGGMGLEAVAAGIKEMFGEENIIGSLADIAGSLLTNFAMATLAMSFILYYVIPFMPFIYFIFAAGGWVKAIFEAIVAMPLWALAHLRIDGEGMPGQSAAQGYFMLLEIFLRPILIIFGLLASIQIFSALVKVMNEIFTLVVQNVGGFDRASELTGVLPSAINLMRGSIDEFFFTGIYVILCYMMGLGCFKLIDRVPNNIMRWIGASISPMVEQEGQAASQLVGQAYQGTTLLTQRIEGGKLAMLLSK